MHSLTICKTSRAINDTELQPHEFSLAHAILKALSTRVSEAFFATVRRATFTYEVDETNDVALQLDLEVHVPDVGTFTFHVQQVVMANQHIAKLVAEAAIGNMHESLTRFARKMPQFEQALIRARQGLRR